MITWQGPGTLYHKGRTFKAGDVIPAGILSVDRVSQFAHAKKIKVDKPVEPEGRILSEGEKPKRQYNKRKSDDSDFVGDMMQEISEGDE